MIIKGIDKVAGRPLTIRCEFEVYKMDQPISCWLYQAKVFGVYDADTNKRLDDGLWSEYHGATEKEAERKIIQAIEAKFLMPKPD